MLTLDDAPCEHWDTLLARIDDLSSDERIALGKHLMDCERCARALEQYKLLDVLMCETPPLKPPPLKPPPLRRDLLAAHPPYGRRLAALATSPVALQRALARIGILWLEIRKGRGLRAFRRIARLAAALSAALSAARARVVAAWSWTWSWSQTHGARLGRIALVVHGVRHTIARGARLSLVVVVSLYRLVKRLGKPMQAAMQAVVVSFSAIEVGRSKNASRRRRWHAQGEDLSWLDADVSQPLATAGLACLLQSSPASSGGDFFAQSPGSGSGPLDTPGKPGTPGGFQRWSAPRRGGRRLPDSQQRVLLGASHASKTRSATAVAHLAAKLRDGQFNGSEEMTDVDQEIGEERAAALLAAIERWQGAPDASAGPFVGIRLTGADVRWLLLRASAWTNGAGRHPLNLSGAQLIGAHLEALDLSSCMLQGADLRGAHLEGAVLRGARLSEANLFSAHLDEADLSLSQLERADLTGAHLAGCVLVAAQLSAAILHEAHLEAADLTRAHLEGAHLSAAQFDKAARLNEAHLAGAWLDQVVFDNVNLAVVDWGPVRALGEELAARQRKDAQGKEKHRVRRLREYRMAARATWRLASALRSQGLSEPADRFAYRAHVLDRAVLRYQRRWLSYPASLCLDLITGYGYRPLRSVITYLLAVAAFATAYRAIAPVATVPLSGRDALVLSITSLVGRGFVLGDHLALHNPVTMLSAVEAVIGLVTEIAFIAAFTQRYLRR